MSGFNNIWSQRTKVALGRLEQWKIYPNLVTEYLQRYLDPGVNIYCEEHRFHKQKNGGNEMVKEKRLATRDDLAMFGTWA